MKTLNQPIDREIYIQLDPGKQHKRIKVSVFRPLLRGNAIPRVLQSILSVY